MNLTSVVDTGSELISAKTSLIVTVITSGAALIAALVGAGISLWNRRRTDINSREIQALKGNVDRDLERLRARRLHGQTINSTQWKAEFSSYQAIWKGMVGIRTQADKVVNRQEELIELGIPNQHLRSPESVKRRQDKLKAYLEQAQQLLFAIQDNAPFYPAPIRIAANSTHSVAKVSSKRTWLLSFGRFLRAKSQIKNSLC